MKRFLLGAAVLFVLVAGPLYSSFYPLQIDSEWIEPCVAKDHVEQFSEYKPISGFYWVSCKSTGESTQLFVANEKEATFLSTIRNRGAAVNCLIEQKRRPALFGFGEDSVLEPRIKTCGLVNS